MNEEKVKALEKRLSRHAVRRRIITATSMIVFLVIGIVFWSLREVSREVIIHGEGWLSYIAPAFREGLSEFKFHI